MKKKAKRKAAAKKTAVSKKVIKTAAPKKAARRPAVPAPSEESIERALREGPRSNKELRAELGTEDKVLTRTLQRLRRRGALKVVGGRWALTTVQICPTCDGKGWIDSPRSPKRRKK